MPNLAPLPCYALATSVPQICSRGAYPRPPGTRLPGSPAAATINDKRDCGAAPLGFQKKRRSLLQVGDGEKRNISSFSAGCCRYAARSPFVKRNRAPSSFKRRPAIRLCRPADRLELEPCLGVDPAPDHIVRRGVGSRLDVWRVGSGLLVERIVQTDSER